MVVLIAARLAILLAVVAPIIGQDLTPLLAIWFGFVGQVAKSHPKFPNLAAQGIMLGLGLVAYFLGHGYDSGDAHWLDNAIAWTFAVPGYATVIGTAFPKLATANPKQP